MWIDAFPSDPDAFWHQTPRSFQVCMEGVRKRMQREAEGRLIAAYETAAFTRAEKLKPLDHYLKKAKSQKAQSPKEMLATLQSLGGDKMTVRKVRRKERES